MDVSVTTHKDNTYQIYIPYNGDVVLEYDLSVFPVCEIGFMDESGEWLEGISNDEIGYSFYMWSHYRICPNDTLQRAKGCVKFENLLKGVYYIDIDNVQNMDDTYETTYVEIKVSHSHNYKGTVTSESTCTKKGSIKYTCDCGDSYTEEIPLKSHNEVTDYGKAATCTETGLTDGLHCSVCKRCL